MKWKFTYLTYHSFFPKQFHTCLSYNTKHLFFLVPSTYIHQRKSIPVTPTCSVVINFPLYLHYKCFYKRRILFPLFRQCIPLKQRQLGTHKSRKTKFCTVTPSTYGIIIALLFPIQKCVYMTVYVYQEDSVRHH
jgi:hypothetical protein